MDADRFKAMVARLERESAAAPGAYRFKVALLALLGFGVMAVLVGAAGLGILLLVGAALALAFSGGGALILLLKLGKLLIFLAIPLWYLVKASVQAMFIRLPAPQGEEITQAQAPALFAAIADMRQRMNGPKVHHVLVVDEVNAAIVQRPAFGLVGWPRNYLLLGLPLLEGMPPQEALAVVAHEYGHLAGSHGRFGAYIYRLRHTWGTVQAYADHLQGWLGRALQPLVRWYAPYFNAYTFVLARANEYEADAASAELVGPAAMAQALKRTNLVGPAYDAFIDRTFDRLREEAAPPADLGQRWARQATLPPPEGDAQRWLEQALDREGRLDDTHPVLRARLSALPGAGGGAQVLPPPLSGPSAAGAWLGALLPTLRERFQRAWAERVAEPWARRHEELQQQRQRLALLRAQPEHSVDEAFELLRLQGQLEPEADQRTAWADFNGAHPEHALGLYFQALALFKHEDAEGIALLERAITLDADLSKPACEQAHTFLLARKDKAAAQAWAERWQQRDAFETQRQEELQTLNIKHPLQPHALAEAELQQVRDLLAGVKLEYVAALYLARRVLPSDPTLPTYVVGVTLTWWGRRRGKQQAVVDQLAALQWPLHLVVCTLEGQFAKLKKPMQKLAGARLV